MKMHQSKLPKPTEGGANIILGDGHVEWAYTARFNQECLPNTPPTTNWPTGHIPATLSIRLVFP